MTTLGRRIGYAWITVCTLAGLVSLVILLIPVIGSAITHSFSDGSTYGPYRGVVTYTQGNASAKIDTNLVSQKYGVYYTLSDDNFGTLWIRDVNTGELRSTIDMFGSEL